MVIARTRLGREQLGVPGTSEMLLDQRFGFGSGVKSEDFAQELFGVIHVTRSREHFDVFRG